MPTERSKAIARGIAQSIGTRPQIRAYESDHFPGLKVAVLFAQGWPSPDLNMAATIDLGDEAVENSERQYEFYLVARGEWDVEQLVGDVGIRVRRGIVVPEPGEFHHQRDEPHIRRDEGSAPRRPRSPNGLTPV